MSLLSKYFCINAMSQKINYFSGIYAYLKTYDYLFR
jgi:hypothetical protein